MHEQDERAEQIRFVLNNFALEGFEPDEGLMTLIKSYENGEMSLDELLKQGMEYIDNAKR